VTALIDAVPVLCALGVIALLALLAYVAIFEARVQLRNWRIAHRNPRPGFLYDRDDERLPR
jgi:hypothetical protein